MAQIKEQNKSQENELNETLMTNLSDTEFKTLVIGMLRELTEYGKKIGKEMKVTLSEKKEKSTKALAGVAQWIE